MLSFTANQLQDWVALLYWPFVRIGSCFMVVPVFGATPVPARIRVVLAGAITLLIAPLLPAAPAIPAFSAAGALVTVQQVLIGVALGFCLQILFDAVNLGGQMLGNSMGLSMALNVDPLHGSEASTPAVGQLYTLLVTLTFLALNGHLALIEVLVKSFTTLPVGAGGLSVAGLATVVGWGSQLFAGALAIALPGVTALLIVNLAFGVMSRAAPAFNLFAIGLPVSLVFGLVILTVGLPAVQATFLDLLARAFQAFAQLIGAG
ncbi:MAG: flagellar biosynthetic protein FliR [Gammaproteobacteria bacterium]|nr:flagellar biosynthetic protein FliR [Gammaproteobacteria bacterium]